VTQKQKFLVILKLIFSNVNQFTVQESYQVAEGPLSFSYPKNNHIRDKIRQLLQDLEGDGILINQRKGVWGWNKTE
tara:strand:+ start:2448 stop:2675 length:228 start_codon:yes stop_codon:yes gene_type:complete